MLLSSIATKDVVIVGSAEYIGKPVGIILTADFPIGKYPVVTDSMRIFTYDDMYANGDIITVNSATALPRGSIIKLGAKLYSVNGKYAGICNDIHMQKSGARIITENGKSPCAKIVAASDGIILFNPKFRAPKTANELPEHSVNALPATIDTAVTEVIEPTRNSDYAFMLGKRLKSEVSDIGRSFVLMAGTVITDRVIHNAKRAGKLTDLYNSIEP